MARPFDARSTTDEVLEGVDLTGRRVLLTGVSAGLGVETARALVAHGAHVIGAARDLAKARSATAQFGTNHLGHFTLVNHVRPMLRHGARVVMTLWAGVVAAADAVGGCYCEDCHVAETLDDPRARARVRPYALDAGHAQALWAKSEALVGERF